MTDVPDMLTAAQIRGARAMLDWSMIDLARAAHVSVSSVKRVEDDGGSEAEVVVSSMRDAFETAGVCFLSDDGDGPGVRLRQR